MSSVCFKPCYKWITFNINSGKNYILNILEVLNLVINGLPSIFSKYDNVFWTLRVLNLVINGLPSIYKFAKLFGKEAAKESFKPCYKWITFNIMAVISSFIWSKLVLNLVINGLPSIWKMKN